MALEDHFTRTAGQDAIAAMSRSAEASMAIVARANAERAGLAWTMFEALKKQVTKFEDQLADGEETAAWLANFGADVTLVITEIAYRHPHLIILKGEDQHGRRQELLQHVAQVSLLLVAVPTKSNQKARRIGFRAEANDKER
jgi:hypothetical protein